MSKHTDGVTVKPAIPAPLLAKVAGLCVGTAREMMLAEGDDYPLMHTEVAKEAVGLARAVIVQAYRTAAAHNLPECRGPQAVGLGENDTESDMDEIPYGGERA